MLFVCVDCLCKADHISFPFKGQTLDLNTVAFARWNTVVLEIFDKLLSYWRHENLKCQGFSFGIAVYISHIASLVPWNQRLLPILKSLWYLSITCYLRLKALQITLLNFYFRLDFEWKRKASLVNIVIVRVINAPLRDRIVGVTLQDMNMFLFEVAMWAWAIIWWLKTGNLSWNGYWTEKYRNLD